MVMSSWHLYPRKAAQDILLLIRNEELEQHVEDEDQVAVDKEPRVSPRRGERRRQEGGLERRDRVYSRAPAVTMSHLWRKLRRAG